VFWTSYAGDASDRDGDKERQPNISSSSNTAGCILQPEAAATATQHGIEQQQQATPQACMLYG
jgi:hypothetical protein